MKKRICIMVIAMMIMLSSCGNNRYYDDGYEAGYSDGYSDGITYYSIEHDDYSRGYDDGHSDGYQEGYNDSKIEFALNLIETAEHYAHNQTGYSVYEAWNDILIYQDQPNGYTIPTDEEYRQCVETLAYFCEYLDNADFYD